MIEILFYPAAEDNPAWDCGKLKEQFGHEGAIPRLC